MLRPKLTLHVGEHALTNICHRHRLALLVCIPRGVHVSSFERHFHSIEIPFPIDSVPPLARLASVEASERIAVRDDEPDETIADRREGRQNRTVLTLTMTPCMMYRCRAKLQSCGKRRVPLRITFFFLIERGSLTRAIRTVHLAARAALTIVPIEGLFSEIYVARKLINELTDIRRNIGENPVKFDRSMCPPQWMQNARNWTVWGSSKTISF